MKDERDDPGKGDNWGKGDDGETKMTGDEETDEEQSKGFSTCEQFQSLLADTDGVECGK